MKTRCIYGFVVLCLAGSANASDGPVLRIPDGILGNFSFPVAAPILFTSNDTAVSAILFSLDFDETCLEFDPTDDDPEDGIPDDIIFELPSQFSGAVEYRAEDTDGELDFVIADFGPPLASLPDGSIAYVVLTPVCQPEETAIIVRVGFSEDPPASFGDTEGQNVSGTSIDGSIIIEESIFTDGFESGDTSAWSITTASG